MSFSWFDADGAEKPKEDHQTNAMNATCTEVASADTSGVFSFDFSSESIGVFFSSSSFAAASEDGFSAGNMGRLPHTSARKCCVAFSYRSKDI